MAKQPQQPLSGLRPASGTSPPPPLPGENSAHYTARTGISGVVDELRNEITISLRLLEDVSNCAARSERIPANLGDRINQYILRMNRKVTHAQ